MELTKAKNFLIWFFILPLFFLGFLVNIRKAQAAEPQTVSGPTIYTPRFYSPDESNIYFENQVITIHINYGQVGLRVTADLTVIDRSMPVNMPVKDNASGTYTLTTPALYPETMVMGPGIAIPFTAVDQAGNMATVNSTYLVDIRTYPLKGGAEFNAPARLSALSGDGQVHLWWTSIPGAYRILVRYQDDQGFWRQVALQPENSDVIIRNLRNGYNYQFMVAGQGSSGTVGEVKIIWAAPVAPQIEQPAVPQEVSSVQSQPPVEENKSQPAIGGAHEEPQEKVAQVPAQETPTEVAKSEEKKPEEQRNWNRLLLAISILIIAAGAAIGGYYGYEWWMARREEPFRDQGPKSKSRW